jgi:nucleoside-diphosphate-sugar epimerase
MAVNLLLTGATGFLGSRLAAALHSKPDVNLTASTRLSPSASITPLSGYSKFIVRSDP